MDAIGNHEKGHMWKLEPHICRHCFARILSRPGADGQRVYQCSNCGHEAIGDSPAVLCSCGIKLRQTKTDGRPGDYSVDAGIRCHRNPAPTPEFPGLYVASSRPGGLTT